MAKYRKRPVEVEARRIPEADLSLEAPGLIAEWNDIAEWCGGFISGVPLDHFIRIETLEGVMHARAGDWIVKGTQGEFYPVKPQIFEETFEEVVEEEVVIQ